MKSGLFLVIILLAMATLACVLGAGPTPAPTLRPTLTPLLTRPAIELTPPYPVVTSTAEPTPTLEPTAVPTAVPPQVKIVLANPWVTPAQVRVVDARSAETITTFTAPGLQAGPQVRSSVDSITFMNENSTAIHRTGFDGAQAQLTFMHEGTGFFDAAFLPSPDGTKIAWGSVNNFDTSNGAVDVSLNTAGIDGSVMSVLLAERRTLPSRPQPLRWSNDGSSLYFTNVPYGIGGYILFFDGPDLQKVDLKTHSITTILKNSSCMCALSISPDERQVAYTRQGDASIELFVQPLAGGAGSFVALPVGYQQAGAIVWAPDGQSLAMTLALGNPDGEAYSIVRIDLSDMSLRVLLPNDARLVQTVAWPVAEWIWVQDTNRNVYRMDPATGALTPAGTSEMIVRGGG